MITYLRTMPSGVYTVSVLGRGMVGVQCKFWNKNGGMVVAEMEVLENECLPFVSVLFAQVTGSNEKKEARSEFVTACRL